jgi:ParB family chromosome partitioning protein
VVHQVPYPAARRRSRVQDYPIDYLTFGPWQPRVHIDDDTLDRLVGSISRYGLIGHLEVRPDPDDPQGRVQLVFGHRRLLAAKRAGLATIPVAVVDRTDDEMRTIALIENDTAEALTPWERALCIARIRRETGWTLHETAKQFGRSVGWVQARHDLTLIPEHAPLRAAIEDNRITMTDATTLATMPAVEQARLLPQVVAGEINVQQLRDMKPRRRAPLATAKRRRGVATGSRRLADSLDAQTAGAEGPASKTLGASTPSRTAGDLPGPAVDVPAPAVDLSGELAQAPAAQDDEQIAATASRSGPANGGRERVRRFLLRLEAVLDGPVADLEEDRQRVDLALLIGDDRRRLDAARDRIARFARMLGGTPGDRVAP